MESEKNGVTWWMWIIISIVLLLIVAAMFWSLLDESGLRTAEITLSVWLIIGIIALIVALSLTAVIFRSLGLANTTHALGLPEGSIRATIALSLILIFMMSSVFLYSQVENRGLYVSRGMTQEQIAAMPNESIVRIIRTSSNQSLFDVTLFVEKQNTASVDIAKQIITTVSTLVVAIAGFYFGTQAVMAAKGSTVTPTSVPVIRRVEPTEHIRDDKEFDFKVFGKNFELAKEVKLIRESSSITCSDVKSSPDTVTCKMKITKQEHPAGKYTVIVINSDGGEDRFEDAFEVKD